MIDNKINISKRLKDVRLLLGLSSGDFAQKSGIDPRNYSSIETGKRAVGERILKDVCSAFQVNLTWLLTGEGEMLKPTASIATPSETNTVAIPLDVWAVIKDQAASLKAKDEQIGELIKSKDEQMNRALNIIEEQVKKSAGDAESVAKVAAQN